MGNRKVVVGVFVVFFCIGICSGARSLFNYESGGGGGEHVVPGYGSYGGGGGSGGGSGYGGGGGGYGGGGGHGGGGGNGAGGGYGGYIP
ncbi:hypothetical protein Hdeb2414_s0018g00531621 [Helianthus debilis subsp. tardiflorus]